MLSLLSKVGHFLWRSADADESSGSNSGILEYQSLNGVVTRFCNEYGLINDNIYFTNDDVVGGEPLSIGQKVNVVFKEDRTSGGLRALMVNCISERWDTDSPIDTVVEDVKIKVLIGNITSCNKDGGDINQTTYFSTCNLCEGYVPYKGDWVKAEYFVNPSTWNSEACSVKPLRCKRVDKVLVSALYGRNGVLDESIFFTLDSIKLPQGYQPKRQDVVNAVVIESSQSCYVWRALCMAPVKKNGNKGQETHSLIACKLAGWEKGNIFKFIMRELKSDSLDSSSPASVSSLLPVLGACSNINNHLEDQADVYEAVRPGLRLTNGLRSTMCHVHPLLLANYPKSVIGATTALTYGVYKHRLLEEVPGMNKLTVNEESLKAGTLTNGSSNQATDIMKIQPSIGISESMVITPGQKTFITINCEAINPGRCKELLLFCFTDFVIGRYLEAKIESEEESILLPSTVYSSNRGNPMPESVLTNRKTVPAPPQKRSSRRQLPSFLPLYPIPDRLRKCVEQNMDILALEPCLAEVLSLSIFCKKMSTLIWLEDVQNEMELKAFSLSGVCLQKCGGFLLLEVPGLAEGRPSLFPGDKVLLKYQDYTTSAVQFVGIVVEIHEEELTLRVNSEFEESYGFEPMDVEFVFSRVSSRRCQFAIEQAEYLGQKVLFPEILVLQSPQVITTESCRPSCADRKEKNYRRRRGPLDRVGQVMLSLSIESKEHQNIQTGNQNSQISREKNIVSVSDMVTVATQTNKPGKESPSKERGEFFNHILNEHQKLAVKRILSGECRPMPYILFGPPGTGKTITVIEAILQIYYTLPDSRVLVCAPSNSAADLVCLRLHESQQLEPGSMVRVNASSRQEETINDTIKQYCGAGEDIRKASRFRIIISTCSSAGMFYQIGLRVGHFTHVFVDESGQASEPECLIPLGLVSEVNGQIILAGDPKQLGPVIKSNIASAYGLNVSLLERLMARPLYMRDEKTYGACGNYNPLLITKLLKNYRSHAALLHLPSKLFYHKELEVCADPAVVNRLLRWDKLPQNGFPLVFHGIRGTEMREGSNPSWFNPSEAVQVMRYCCILAKHVTTSVSAKDIGVITPYRKQVEKIRTLLRTVDLPDIKVGSVEEFQGQEFLVIIISMVRSREDSLHEDSRYLLGFLSNPKRFNVATTRAKALLIVVGNPHILVKDPCVCALLEYGLVKGAYTGCNLPPGLESLQQ
ncbi:RNA helicase Mov10l1 [Bombina bombina]|uniref:RNA helicase Mov10l1 n=1 Tax=Bombina bombina TaxID=8345 RepID=UPI00235A4F73|nr:RNA helicase Mov10l1 [Bombina bombina]